MELFEAYCPGVILVETFKLLFQFTQQLWVQLGPHVHQSQFFQNWCLSIDRHRSQVGNIHEPLIFFVEDLPLKYYPRVLHHIAAIKPLCRIESQ